MKKIKEKAKTRNIIEWFETKNPVLGNVSPVDMIKAGREKKLCKFIINALEENKS